MKKNRILSVFSALALLMAGACSDDTLDSGKGLSSLGPDEAGGVFMTVDFSMPNGMNGDGTRSQTINDGQSNHGVEEGYEEENYVTNALVVLASTEAKTAKIESENISIDQYGYLVAGEVRSNHIQNLSSENNGVLFKAAAQLSKTNLTTFYQMYSTINENGEEVTEIPEVYVFVFCNPTKELINKFANSVEEGGIKFGSSDWVNMTCDVIQGDPGRINKNIGIWGANSFLMNNKYLTKRKLPKRLLDWENYNSYTNAFHLSDLNEAKGSAEEVDNSVGGPVIVERSVARFDYKDGSKTENSRYEVLYMSGKDGNIDETKPIVGVELMKMCLVNMGNRFYYLPRVSDNGLMDGTGYQLCGREKPWTTDAIGIPTGGNYVVGPWAEYFKNAAEMDVENLASFYDQIIQPQVPDADAKGFYKFVNYPFFDADGTYNPNDAANRWDVVKISDVKNGKPDKYDGTNATEPINPAPQPGDYRIWRYLAENIIPAGVENQVNGISTGVVFKAKLTSALKDGGAGYEEEAWNKGALQNLANCLDGKPFTFNGQTITLNGHADHDPILYYFGGTLYMGWRHMRQAAIQASVTINVSGGVEINRSTSLYRAVFGNGPIPPATTDPKTNQPSSLYITSDDEKVYFVDPQWKDNSYDVGEYQKSPNYLWNVWADGGKKEFGDDATGTGVSPSLKAMREAMTEAGITIYQSAIDNDFADDPGNGAGYYCYYYYWNRHNDNLKDGTMGPMEFDVVRNNVYKLRVDAIKRLGHPRIPENDPNNPKPNTPDESDYIYLDVKIDIVPWIVRLNRIIFDNNY